MKKLAMVGLVGISLAGINVINSDACGLGDVDFTTKANLNLRTAPNTSGKVITTLKKGTIVTPYEKQGEWVKVTINGSTGWLSFNYLQMIDNCTIPSFEIEQINNIQFITTSNLNARTQPNENGSILHTFKKNTKLIAYKKCGDWYFVEDGHMDGWVSGKYLKEYTNSQAQEQGITHFVGMVNVGNGKALNLRQDRTQNSRIIAKIPNGSKVSISYEVNGWMRVSYKDINNKEYVGYVSSKYVK